VHSLGRGHSTSTGASQARAGAFAPEARLNCQFEVLPRESPDAPRGVLLTLGMRRKVRPASEGPWLNRPIELHIRQCHAPLLAETRGEETSHEAHGIAHDNE
jgi:hypothetical protein